MAQRKNFRYLIIGLVLAIMTINYVDRGVLAYASQDIIAEFGLSTIEWGSILGFFGYGYVVGGLVGGFLNDKYGPRVMWIGSATLWSVCVALTAFAGNIGVLLFGGSATLGFLVVRVLFGFSEGPSFVTMSKTMANWVGPKERAFTSSITLIGTPLGSLIAAPVAIGLMLLFDWRVMFLVLGALGIIWVLIFSRVFTNLPEQNRRVGAAEIGEIRSGDTALKVDHGAVEKSNVHWWDFFRNPSYLLNTVGFFAISYIIFMLLTWTPKYLQDVYDTSLSSLWYLGMITWIGPIFTTPLGGKIADRVAARTGNLRLARNGVAFVSLLVSGVSFLMIPLVGNMYGVLALMALGNSAALMSNSIYWSNLIDINPANTGTFAGIMHFLGQTAAVAAPTITGFVVESSGYNAAFILAGVICLAGMICVSFIRFDRGDRGRDTTAAAAPAGIAH